MLPSQDFRPSVGTRRAEAEIPTRSRTVGIVLSNRPLGPRPSCDDKEDNLTSVDQRLFALNFVSALGTGLMAGVFFTFSSFLMGALGRLQPSPGIEAMQSVNVVAITPLFMILFFGTTVACAGQVVSSLLKMDRPGATFALAGGSLYIIGAFLVTVAVHIPLNDALAKADPASPEGAQLWAGYLVRWTAWNHLRTLAAIGASAFLVLALFRSAKS